MEIRPSMIGSTELGEAIDLYDHARNGGALQQSPFKATTSNCSTTERRALSRTRPA